MVQMQVSHCKSNCSAFFPSAPWHADAHVLDQRRWSAETAVSRDGEFTFCVVHLVFTAQHHCSESSYGADSRKFQNHSAVQELGVDIRIYWRPALRME